MSGQGRGVFGRSGLRKETGCKPLGKRAAVPSLLSVLDISTRSAPPCQRPEVGVTPPSSTWWVWSGSPRRWAHGLLGGVAGAWLRTCRFRCRAACGGGSLLISPERLGSPVRTGSAALAVVHRCADTLAAPSLAGGCLSTAASSDTRSAAALHPVRLGLGATGDQSEAGTQGFLSEAGGGAGRTWGLWSGKASRRQ